MSTYGYLCHHGIKGMHWGIRRYQNPDGSLTAEGIQRYGKSTLKRSKQQNVDKWGKSKDTNLMYISGQSGSGKSTLALSLSDKRTNVIHLDDYFDNKSQKGNSDFNKFLKSKGEDPKFVMNARQKGTKEFGKSLVKFERYLEEFGKSQYGNKKVIAEGVQLMDDTIRPDKSYFNDKPYIMTRNNKVLNTYRARMRDRRN